MNLSAKLCPDWVLNWTISFEEEHDMGLGNGGLGRLAACFLTLWRRWTCRQLDTEFIINLVFFVKALPMEDKLKNLMIGFEGNPWEIVRPQYMQKVKLYGHVEHQYDDLGNYRPRWIGYKEVEGIPYDLAIVGFETETVNFLRLWESKSSQELDFEIFNQGGYVEAVREKAMGETISRYFIQMMKPKAVRNYD